MNADWKREWLCPSNALVALAAGAMLTVAGAASAGVIKVGVSMRMKTETGEKYGQMVVDEFNAINAAGGVNGNTIEIKLLNDECKSDIGVAERDQVRLPGTTCICSSASTCSSVSLPIVDVVHKAGVPMLIPHSTKLQDHPEGQPVGVPGADLVAFLGGPRPQSTRPRTSARRSPTSGHPTPRPRPTRRSSSSTSRPTTASRRSTPSSSRKGSWTFEPISSRSRPSSRRR